MPYCKQKLAKELAWTFPALLLLLKLANCRCLHFNKFLFNTGPINVKIMLNWHQKLHV